MTRRTWFITGVSSGFGRLITEQLLERGDRVARTVRKMDSMNDLMTVGAICNAVEGSTNVAHQRRIAVQPAAGHLPFDDLLGCVRRVGACADSNAIPPACGVRNFLLQRCEPALPLRPSFSAAAVSALRL
jgi:NAD(P)-dependent dehydrogenase (short-subunit alcohol dehydrogenase family)